MSHSNYLDWLPFLAEMNDSALAKSKNGVDELLGSEDSQPGVAPSFPNTSAASTNSYGAGQLLFPEVRYDEPLRALNGSAGAAVDSFPPARTFNPDIASTAFSTNSVAAPSGSFTEPVTSANGSQGLSSFVAEVAAASAISVAVNTNQIWKPSSDAVGFATQSPTPSEKSAKAPNAASSSTYFTWVIPNSNLSFYNTYGSDVSAAYLRCIEAAETFLAQNFTSENPTELHINFDAALTNPNDLADNNSNSDSFSYTTLATAISEHVSTSEKLPTSDPSGGAGFTVPVGYADMLGLDDVRDIMNVSLNTTAANNWSYGQDVIGTLEHEITEGGMGRIGGLGIFNGNWEAMDLFRYYSNGKPNFDPTSNAAYFSDGDGVVYTGLTFNDPYAATGTYDKTDFADWSNGSPPDAFGPGSPGQNRYVSSTDISIMAALGWNVQAPDTWDFNGGGTWSDWSNWSFGAPATGDRVSIAEGSPLLQTNAGTMQTLQISSGATLYIDYAGSIATLGNLTNNGSLILEEVNFAAGGPSLNVTGTLYNNDSLQIGNSNDLLGANIVATVGALVGSGAVDVFGGTAFNATLTVSTAAGFGATGVVASDVTVADNASIVFASGQITSIAVFGGTLTLSGSGAQIDDQGASGANTALASLAAVNGALELTVGASLTVSGGLSNGIAGEIGVDATTAGGSDLFISGTFANSDSVTIGNTGLTSNSAISAEALNNASAGQIDIVGDISKSAVAQLALVGAASNAGVIALSDYGNLYVGGKFVNSGTVDIDSSSRPGGSIMEVDGTLTNSHQIAIGNASLASADHLLANILSNLAGGTITVAGSGGIPTITSTLTFSNSSSNAGTILLENGGSIAGKGNFLNSGNLDLDTGDTYGGGSVSISGTLTNSNAIQIGNAGEFSVADTITTGGLANAGSIILEGNGGSAVIAAFAVKGAATNSGTIALTRGALLSATGAFTNGGTLTLDQSSTVAGSALTVGGVLINSGTISIGNSVNSSYPDQVSLGGLNNTSTGTIAFVGDATLAYWAATTGQSIKVSGAAANDGLISITGGMLRVNGAVTGAGTIALNGNAELEIATSDSNNISFSGTQDLLKLDSFASSVTGTISGFAADDGIDLVGTVATNATFNADRTQVTVYTADSQQTYNISGVPSTYGILLKNDGNGGTDLDLVPEFHWASAVSGVWTDATEDNWTPSGDPTLGDIADLDAIGASYTVSSTQNNGVEELNISANATLAIGNGTTFEIGDRISNSGTIALNAAGTATTLKSFSSIPIVLSGGGRVVLSDDAHNLIESTVSGSTLDNVDNVVSGAGVIAGATGFSFDNEANGVVSADGANALVFSSLSIINNGLMQTTSSGGLQISGLVSGAGKLLATGANAHVDLAGAIVSGGTLATANGGVINVKGSSNVLNGATSSLSISGNVQVDAGGRLGLMGSIQNTGSLTVATGGQLTMSGLTTLTGGGSVSVSSGASLAAAGLYNVDNAITIAGTLTTTSKITGGILTNEASGVVDDTSTIRSTLANIVNAGLVEDTGAGGILLQGSISNAGGTIEAIGAGSHVDLSIADIVGGTLNTLNGGVIQTTGSLNELDGSTTRVTNLGALQISYGTVIAGTIDNEGAITLNGSDLTLLYGKLARLTGSGAVIMTSGSSFDATVNLHGAAITTLDNVGNTITGTGTFYDSLINETAATVDATGLMSFDGSLVKVTNVGLMEATGSGLLSFQGDVITNTGVIEAIGADAEISMVDLTLRGGTLRTTGGATIATDSSFYLDGATDGGITLDITQILSAYSLVGSLSFANDGGLSFVAPQSVPRTAISVYAGNALLKTGGGGISQVDLNGNILANYGTVGATSGVLLIVDGTIAHGGTIAASGTGSVTLYQDDLQGGTLRNSGTGSLTLQGASTWDGSTSLGAVHNQARVTLSTSSSLNLLGVLSNTGTIIASSSVTLASKSVTLTGAGLLTLIDVDIASAVTGDVFANSNTIFEENGVIGSGFGVDLQNTGVINLFAGALWLDHLYDPTHTVALPQSVNKGTIEAIDGTTSTVESAPVQNGQLDIPVSDFTNSGTLKAGASSTLLLGAGVILTNFSTSVAGELIGGVWEANGSNSTLVLTRGVIIDAATLVLSGTGSQIEGSDSNSSLETTLTTVAAGGKLEVLGNRSYATGNAFTLAGATQGAAGGILQLSGGEFFSSQFSAGVGSTLTGFGVVTSQNGTESGAVDSVGGTLEFNGVSMAFSGAIAGAGNVTFDGEASVVLNSGAMLSVAALTLSGSGTAVEVAETAAYAGLFSLGAGSSLSIDVGDTFDLTGKSTISGIIGGGTLMLGGGGSTLLHSGASFFSYSDLVLSGVGTSLEVAEALAFSQGNFNEGSGALVTVDAGDTFTLTATATLAGTVEGSGALTLAGSAHDLLASGAALSIAKLALSDSGTSLEVAETLTYTGNFAAAAGTLLTVDGGDSFTLGGQISLGGAIIAGSGATVLMEGVMTNTGALEAGPGGAVTFAPAAKLTNNVNGTLKGGTFEADQGGVMTLTGGVITTDAASIILQRAGAVLQSGAGASFTSLQQSLKTIAAGGSLTISGGAYAFSDAIALNGTLSVYTPPISGASAGTFTSGLITASLASTVQSLFGNGTIASSLNDAGSVFVSNYASLTFTGAQDTFSGTFKSSASLLDDIYFASGADTFAAGASLTNSNTVFDGAAVRLTVGVVDTGNFAMSSGTLVLSTNGNSNTFTVAQTANLSGGVLKGSGFLALDGATTLSALTVSDGATLTNAGSLNQTGVLTLGAAGGLQGTVVNMAGDSLSLTGSSARIAVAAGGAGNVTNAGTIVGSTAGTSSIGVAIANSGLISATGGALDLKGAVTGSGTLSVQGDSTLQFDAAVASTQAFVFSDDLGTLMMKDSNAFDADIFGFEAGDTIDFADFGPAGTKFVYTPADGLDLGGVLTLTNGAHTATLLLAGSSYSAAGFSLVSDGHGGADIVYSGVTQHVAHA